MTDTLAPEVRAWRTPRGSVASMEHRPGTSDWNTLTSCLNEDEYGLADVHLGSGVAIDIGAHVGGVTVALALDNPDARVIAVEALSANVEALRRNVERNGVADRVTVLHAVAHRPGKRTATVRWGFGGGEDAEHHRYIGNAQRLKVKSSEQETVPTVSLADLLTMAGGTIDFAKVDCEGGEYDLLADPRAVGCVREYRGEHHAGIAPIAGMLDATHHVTMTSGTEAFGGFRAVAR